METNVAQVVDHLFRRESGRLVAILTRQFGVAHLHLAEDVVQDALMRAMQVWPFSGVPDNPSAWLLRTAQNRALDQARRASVWRKKQPTLTTLLEESSGEGSAASAAHFEDEINDSQLRMMFVCCHPNLAHDAQVALILKTLCGLDEREIAAAFLSSTAAITKKLVRARKLLRDARVAMELPTASRLGPRIESVLQALYLLFNEGYKASHGDSLLRADLCTEAIRLGELLASHAIGARAETHALLALMHLHAARLPARVGDDGSLLILAAQDRSRWDRRHVQRGLQYLEKSGTGVQLTRWHLEAGIAACHALAPSYANTNWQHILELYDELLARDESPIVALNRAIALAQVDGPEAGLRAVDAMPQKRALESYHLFHAVRGQLLLEAGHPAEGLAALRRAEQLAVLPAERLLLSQRIEAHRRPTLPRQI